MLRDLHRDPAVIAVIFCQNDSVGVAPVGVAEGSDFGSVARFWAARMRCRVWLASGAVKSLVHHPLYFLSDYLYIIYSGRRQNEFNGYAQVWQTRRKGAQRAAAKQAVHRAADLIGSGHQGARELIGGSAGSLEPPVKSLFLCTSAQSVCQCMEYFGCLLTHPLASTRWLI